MPNTVAALLANRVARVLVRGFVIALAAACGTPAVAQENSTSLDSLVARAVRVSPTVRAIDARVAAARTRVAPAATRPDPVLMGGIQNLPLGREAMSPGPDPMTMRMIGIGQTIPYPGKLSARQRVAELDLESTRVGIAVARADIAYRVRSSFFELAYLDRAIAISAQQRTALAGITQIAEQRYGAGTGSQSDMLTARLEMVKAADEANALAEQRVAGVAILNALLDRPSSTPIDAVMISERLRRAAITQGDSVEFTSTSVDARARSSPLPPLETLQQAAVTSSPMLKEHEARIATQSARVRLAERERKPDVDISLQYGQRPGRPDMITAEVSLPIPTQRSRRQDQDVAQASAELAALEAEHHAQLNELRAEVARLHSEIERQRTKLAFYTKAVLPQARAIVDATTVAYATGKGELRAVLEAQSSLLSYELSYERALTDFASRLAELTKVVGQEVVP